MPAKFATANAYTDAELLLLAREAYAQIMANGTSYSYAGRNWTAAQLPQLEAAIDRLEERIDSDSGVAKNLARLVRR